MDRPQLGDRPSAGIEQEVQRLHNENAAGMLRYGLLVCGSLETVQDAVQETFLQYFVARSAGSQIPVPKIWLYRALRVHLREAETSRNRRGEVRLEAALHSADTPHGQGRISGQMETLWPVLEAALAPRELECLKLRAEGFEYSEIAGVLGLRCGTVGALLVRAHKKIRKLIPPNARDFAIFALGEKLRNPEWKRRRTQDAS
jgi:RNA polymerase sigma-70 factor (ECF subfamily)